MTITSFWPALRSVRDDDRWCMPRLTGYDAADSRLDDVSVSYARFGSPAEHSHCVRCRTRRARRPGDREIPETWEPLPPGRASVTTTPSLSIADGGRCQQELGRVGPGGSINAQV